MKKIFLLLSLLAFAFLPPSAAQAAGEICGSNTPCCVAPGNIECAAGQVWIGDALTGSCQAPVACGAGRFFMCATNTCATATCSTSAVNTGSAAACCPDGALPVRTASGWACGTGLTLSSGNVVIDGDVSVNGDILPSGVACADGQTLERQAGAWVCAAGGSGSFSESAGDVYRETGNFGLGNNDPDQTLHVTGVACIDADGNDCGLIGASPGDLAVSDDIYFYGELMPEGNTCAIGQYLIKNAADQWICSTPHWTASGSGIYNSSGDVAIGTTPNNTIRLYSYTNEANGFPTYGIYAYNRNTSGADTYGSYSIGFIADSANVETAYGLYAVGLTNSSTCAVDCAESFGVYAQGQGVFSTGLYAVGDYIGVHAVSPSTSTSSGNLALLVEQERADQTAALFDCVGDCTSAIFSGGNNSSYLTSNSGYVIVGSTGGAHLSVDVNGLQAKSNGNTVADLHLNTSGDGSVVVNMSHNPFTSSVCRSGETLGYCSSLAILKKNIADLRLGLATVKQLRPVQFQWKDREVASDALDLGFLAEEVESVDPLLAQYDDGKLTGVKYDKLTALLTKAVQELSAEVDKKQAQINELKTLVCLDHPEAEVCRN